MSKPKLFCFDSNSYYQPFKDIFDLHYRMTPSDLEELRKEIQVCDAVLFTGGMDVDPGLYGERPGKYTYADEGRTKYENVVFTIAQEEKKKFLGICRGAQFLCVKAGGKLIQHVNNHGRDHEIIDTRTGDKLTMSSLHHQMMYPAEGTFTLLGHSDKHATTYLDGDNTDLKEKVDREHEPDVVWFQGIQGLGFQGHPEMMNKADKEEEKTLKWVEKITREFLL